MTQFANRSFWLDNAGEYDSNSPLKEDISVDVAIVGGGFTGLSTAYNLRKMDADTTVVLLEGEIIGFGASGRNGGWIIPQFGADPYMVPSIYGIEKYKQAQKYLEDGFEYIARMVEEYKMDCDYRQTGVMKLALGPGTVPLLKKFAKQADKLGMGDHIKWLDKTTIQAEFDSPVIEAGIYEPNLALYHPVKMVREWKRIAEEVGAVIYENTPAITIDRTAGKVEIVTPRGTITANKVVLATNAYSHLQGGSVGKEVKRDQMPAFPILHITEQLTDEQWESVVSKSYQCPVETTLNLYHGYTPTADRRVILWYFQNIDVSTNEAMEPHEQNPENAKIVKRHWEAIFPTLKDVRFAQSWGGPVSMTADMVPHLGYVGDERVILSSGCLGHGVCGGMYNGITIAEMLLGKTTERTEMWFIKRKPMKWPVAPLGAWGFKSVVKYMKWEDRGIMKKTPLADIDKPFE